MGTKLKTSEEKLKNSIGMQLQFYIHSGETIEATVGRINELALDYAKQKAIEFEGWVQKLPPSEKVSVWSKNGEYKGIFTMDTEQLFDKFLSQQKSKNNID